MGLWDLKFAILYQEEVLLEDIIWSLKGDATDMVTYLDPTPSVVVILDKLDSLYGLVPPLMLWCRDSMESPREEVNPWLISSLD